MAKKAMNVRVRDNGTLEYRFTVDGKRYSVYGMNAKELRAKELELRESIRNGTYTKKRNITLEQYYKEWLRAKQSYTRGNTELGIKNRYENHIRPALGKRKIVDIEKREIIKLQQELLKTQKASSVNAIITQLKDMLNSAVADNIIVKSPAATVKAAKTDAKKATETYHRALTEEEQALFVEEAQSEWLYEMIALMLCTGLRIGEAAALRWSDIDYANNMIHITKTITRTATGEYTEGAPKSKTGTRDIPMNDIIKGILKSQRAKQTALFGNVLQISHRVFTGISGTMVYNAVANSAITRTLKRLEAKGHRIEHFSAHALRDIFATRYIEKGGTPQTLKTILGHSSLAMTMDLYAHVLPNTKQNEMNVVADAFTKVMG